MSSFIIEKKEFLKAAGLMCGYEEAKRDSHKWFVENVRKEFEHVYALNVASVNEQYGDNEMPENEEGMDELFEAYRKKGALIQREGYASSDGIIFEKVEDVMDKATFRRSMFVFFDSVLYQIEDPESLRVASSWFYGCLDKLYIPEKSGVEGWWGHVDL